MSEAEAAAAAPEPTPKKKPDPAPAAAPPSPVQEAVDAWVREHIHNTAVSRDVDAYNHLISVLPQLVSKLSPEA